MTETEKMLAGKLYNPADPELCRLRTAARRLCKLYNDTFADEREVRTELLKQLVPHLGEGTFLLGPIQFDYGVFTSIGAHCFANNDLTILDCCPVTIGDDVLFGPHCTLATPMHPLLAEERRIHTRPDGSRYDLEYAKPITIGDGCWLAANVVVCGGVTIGRGSVIGAGSVVTRDIPAGVLAAGNPCRVIREITAADSVELKRELWP